MKKSSWRKEREFGLIVGGVFVMLTLWWIYRGKFPIASKITLPLGATLLLLGIILPRALVWPNRIWMALAEVLSFISTRIILGVVYFLVLTPIGFFKRLSGWDPLNRRAQPGETYWRPYSERQRDRQHFEKMY